MDDDVRIISTTEELKILSDPFRLSIVHTYREHGKPLTVKGCADILHEVPSKVSYHVKKLIKIKVLELDHIEVINGINAKYYYLPKKRFTLQLQQSDEQTMENNLKHLINMTISQIENFKMDFVNMSHTAFANKAQTEYEIGWLSFNNIYLSETEYDDLQKMIIDYIVEHDQKVDNKRRYSFIMGLAHKEKA